MPKTFSRSEVAKHNSAESLWVVIDDRVHDVTAFQLMHPGGSELLLQLGGQDATEAAKSAHGNSRKAKSLMFKYCIGELAPEEEQFNDSSMQNRKAVPLDQLATANPARMVSLEHLGDKADSRQGPGKLVPLDELASTPKKMPVSLDDFAATPKKVDGRPVPLDDLAATPKKVMALDDLGSVAATQQGPSKSKPKMIALEDLGNDSPPAKSNMVALDQLGQEESGKKMVKLEDLGQDTPETSPATGGLFPRSSRTGRKRTLENKEEKVQQEALVEEANAEEVDPEEDETKAHVKILLSSWALANQEEAEEHPVKSEAQTDDESLDDEPVAVHEEKKESRWQRMKNLRGSLDFTKRKTGKKEEKKAVADDESHEQEESVQALLGSKVPTSYAEMFEFNATVMGFGKHKWLAEVNRSFDDIRTINSARRVNFYVKHLVVREGKFAGALSAICVAQDVKIISNQVLVLLSDTLWAGVVRRQFVLSKVSFLFSLSVFMLSEAILPKMESADELNVRIAVFVGRIINYGFSMLRLLIFHWRRILKAYRTHATTKGRCPVPLYLKDEDARMGLLLLVLLMVMCASEPMFYCAYEIPITGPTEKCAEGQSMMQIYIILSMAAMVLHWLLVINLSVFATKLAAFVLVIREVFGEVGKFMVAIVFILVTFSKLSTLPKAANCLFATTVGIYEGDYREMLHQPALLGAVFMFITVSAILLINLLIAQLNCSYDYVYGDMLGFARLARASLIVDAMVACPPIRFAKFVTSLRFDQLLEFDEGDVGLGGGIQIKEPANLCPTSDDIIQRFGGTSSPEMQWPEEEKEDRYTRIKNLITLLKKPPQEDKSGSKISGGAGTSTSVSVDKTTSKDDTREEDSISH
eukprot:Skav210174  [mRNA]  locus=scaffold5148:21513:25455:+ [translate_table: standard]